MHRTLLSVRDGWMTRREDGQRSNVERKTRVAKNDLTGAHILGPLIEDRPASSVAYSGAARTCGGIENTGRVHQPHVFELV